MRSQLDDVQNSVDKVQSTLNSLRWWDGRLWDGRLWDELLDGRLWDGWWDGRLWDELWHRDKKW